MSSDKEDSGETQFCQRFFKKLLEPNRVSVLLGLNKISEVLKMRRERQIDMCNLTLTKTSIQISRLLTLALAMSALSSSAANVVLSDGTATATINPGGGTGLLGMNEFGLSGQNQLNQQWFWYRVDGLTVNQTIDTIGAPVVTPFNGTRGVTTTYAGGGSPISIQVDYLLTGVSTLKAVVSEDITVKNTSANTLTLHFFQYSNFNLAGTLGGDSGAINKNLFTGLYSIADQIEGSIAFQETVLTPGADRAQIGMPPAALLGLLGTTGDLNNSVALVGPGDLAYAFQWTVVLDQGEELVIGKQKYIQLSVVPEPSTMALVGLGMAAFALRRNRGRA
jgi:hypothetical protein